MSWNGWACGACLGLALVYACGSTSEGPSQPGGTSGSPSAGSGALGSSPGGAGGATAVDTGGSGGVSTAGVAGSGGLKLGLAGDSSGAGASGTGEASCELGEVSSTGTNQDLDLFGNIVYFADGIDLPVGRYRIKYVDGCMKYSAAQDWSLHAYAGAEPVGWWFVGADQSQKVVVPPGSVGFLLGSGGFATFEECVAANLALAPSEFEFAGGKLGVWLQDAPYSDNLAGMDGRNPKWQLTLLGDCDRLRPPE